MNRYQFSTPRAVLALSSMAMTAVTIGALVVLPAKLDGATALPELIGNAIAATDPVAHVATARCGDSADAHERDHYAHNGRDAQ